MAYLVASVLCVMSLGGLASQTTARLGNAWGQVGAFIGILGTVAMLSNGLPMAVFGQMAMCAAVGGSIAQAALGGNAMWRKIQSSRLKHGQQGWSRA